MSPCSIPPHCRVNNWKESTFPVENNLKICTRVAWFGHQDPDFNVLNATLKEIYPQLIQLPKCIIKKATTVSFLEFQQPEVLQVLNFCSKIFEKRQI